MPGFCAMVEGSAHSPEGTLTRTAYFSIPNAREIRLPTTDSPNPGLLKQCVLSGLTMHLESKSASSVASDVQRYLSGMLGPSRPFYPGLSDPLYWLSAAVSWQGGEDSRQHDSPWVIVLYSPSNAAAAVAVSAGMHMLLVKQTEATYTFFGDLSQAESCAEASGMPPQLMQRMRALIRRVADWQHNEASAHSIDLQRDARFLLQWVTASRRLPADRKAAGLYAADMVLGYLNIPANLDRMTRQELDQGVVKLKAELVNAGAQFNYDELGASYSYRHNWMEEAFHAARRSPAGKQAFISMLDRSFEPGGCAADGFEDVIKRAPRYLREYSDPGVRAHILLAIADAYRDRIAVANEANGDPLQEAGRYQRDVQQNYSAALLHYRQAVKAFPGSEAAQKAVRRAWALIAGIKPLDTRFVCIYD